MAEEGTSVVAATQAVAEISDVALEINARVGGDFHSRRCTSFAERGYFFSAGFGGSGFAEGGSTVSQRCSVELMISSV